MARQTLPKPTIENPAQSESTIALLTVPEVAKALHVDARTVWRLIADGHLRIRRIRRSVRIEPAVLLDFIRAS